MLRIVSLFIIAAALSACSSMTHPLPKCAGYSRRPLNRSMWQSEDSSKSKSTSRATRADTAAHVSGYGEETAPVTPAAFAYFDVKGSYRPCQGN